MPDSFYPLTATEVEILPVQDLRNAIIRQVQVRGPGWKDSILRPLGRNSVSELNLVACRIIARMWCTAPPTYGVTDLTPGTVRDGVWQ